MSRRPHAFAAVGDPLSLRQMQVMEAVARGLTNDEIAAELFLSVNTVKCHLEFAQFKLGARNRTHAAVLFSKKVCCG